MGQFDKIYEYVFGRIKGSRKYSVPKTSQARTEELYKVITDQVRTERKIDAMEEDIVYRYNIKSDKDYDDFLAREDLEKEVPEYVDLVGIYKEIISKRVMLEEEFFNVKKGVYLGLGVDLEKIDLTTPKQPVYIPWQHWENHAQVLGTTRYGKTYLLALIAYQMILKGWDIVLIDPKGGKKQELLSWMFQFAMKTGRTDDLIFCNPAYTKYCTLLNPLFGMSNSEVSSVIALLSEGDGEKKDSFFSDVAFIVVLGITTSLEYLERIMDPTGEKAEMLELQETKKYFDMMELRGSKLEDYNVKTKVATPDASARMNRPRDNHSSNVGSINFKFNRSLMTFREIEYYSNYENLQTLLGFVKGTEPPTPENYSENEYKRIITLREEALSLLGHVATLGEFYMKISMSLTALVAKLSTGEIGELFCTVRINPVLNRVYREDKGLIAIIQPAPLKFQKTSDMVNKVFIKMFESLFGTVSVTGRGFQRRIGFLIDEAKVALFPGIEEIYNKAGGMGMTIITFMQSDKDRILKVGEVVSEIIEDNTNTHISMKVNNFASKENIVKNFGTRRIHKRNTMGTDTGTKTMVITEEEYLLDTTAIDRLGKGEAFVSSYGKKYRVKFAFVEPPEGEIIMPEIKEEGILRSIVEKEINLEEMNSSISRAAKEELGEYVMNSFSTERATRNGAM